MLSTCRFFSETGEPELDTIAREIKASVAVNAFHADHRKIVTIDGRVAYCGSANFGAQYQYHRPFDPTKDAKDEADAARTAVNHLKLATFDERWGIVGSANLNFRSMEDDKDFEACVLIDSDEFARGVDRDARDEDLRGSKRVIAAREL